MYADIRLSTAFTTAFAICFAVDNLIYFTIGFPIEITMENAIGL
jgi:hypothetical protein